MPNGKMHRKPPKRLSNYKKATKLEEGLTVARLKGECRFKASQKGITKSLKDHIGKWIDSINPLELAAIATGTVMVHGAIVKGGYIDKALGFWATIQFLASPMLWDVARWGYEQFSGKAEKLAVMPEDSLALWGTSLFIAYIMVKHGGQILGLWEKGFNAAVGMMLT